MRLLIILFMGLFTLQPHHSFSISVPVQNETITPPPPGISALSKMKIKELEKLTGKKFSLKEKLAIKIAQVKIKKELKNQNKEKHQKGSGFALVLGILSLAALYFPFISVPLAIGAIIIGHRAYKKSNFQDKRAKLATTLAVLSLGITVVALMIIGIFVSDEAFGIFILR